MPSSSSSAPSSASSTSWASQIDPAVFRDALDLLSTTCLRSESYICNAIKSVLYARNPDYPLSEAFPYFDLLFDLFDDRPPPPPEEGNRYFRAIFGYGGSPESRSNRIFALLFLLEFLNSPYEPTTKP
jgi:hypothetical protein